jgi:hypothetical protein
MRVEASWCLGPAKFLTEPKGHTLIESKLVSLASPLTAGGMAHPCSCPASIRGRPQRLSAHLWARVDQRQRDACHCPHVTARNSMSKGLFKFNLAEVTRL